MKLGEQGSELKLARPGQVRISAKVAARLPAITDAAFSDRFLPNFRPGISYLERSRVPGTREVHVGVVVNGYPVATNNLVADGTLRDLKDPCR